MEDTARPQPLPSGLGVTACEDAGSLCIVFPPPVRGISRVMLPLWLGMVIFGLVMMARDLPTGLAKLSPDEAVVVIPFIVLFLGVWVTIGAFGTYHSLFNAAGREVIVIDNTHFTFRREVPLFTRVWTYRLAEVRNLRAIHSVVPLWVDRYAANSRYAWDLFGLTGGVIAFDHGGRTVRVGGGIDEEEAQRLVVHLLQRFPSLGGAHP